MVFNSMFSTDPVSFSVGSVILRWLDGILQIREGKVAMVDIILDQAYKDEGILNDCIPGKSTLFFKIYLIKDISPSVGEVSVSFGADNKALKI